MRASRPASTSQITCSCSGRSRSIPRRSAAAPTGEERSRGFGVVCVVPIVGVPCRASLRVEAGVELGHATRAAAPQDRARRAHVARRLARGPGRGPRSTPRGPGRGHPTEILHGAARLVPPPPPPPPPRGPRLSPPAFVQGFGLFFALVASL